MRASHYSEIITIILHVKGLAELQCFMCSARKAAYVASTDVDMGS